MSTMFKTSVRSGVMKLLNKKIEDAQNLYEAHVEDLEDNYEREASRLKVQLVNDKSEAMESAVKSVFEL